MTKSQKDYEKSVYQRSLAAFSGRCALCGTPYDIQMHHVRYGAGGRKTYDGNVIPLCLHCHQKVHTSHRVWMPILIEMLDRKAEEYGWKYRKE